MFKKPYLSMTAMLARHPLTTRHRNSRNNARHAAGRFRFASFALFALALFGAAQSAAAATYTVTTTADSGAGSLRAAVASANGTTATDTIQFSIPSANCSAGICTITLASQITLGTVASAGALTITGTGARSLIIDGGAGTNRIFTSTNANVTLTGVTLTGGGGGNAVDGGAMYIAGGNFTLDGVHLTANNANTGGGVYFLSGGTYIIRNSTVSNNTANNCGGIVNSQSTLTVSNTTISGNAANNGAGAICSDGNFTLRNSTVVNNSAVNRGGGIVRNNAGTLNAGGSIIAGNTAPLNPDIDFTAGTVVSAGYNLIGNNASVEAAFPAGNPNANNDLVGTSAAPLDPQLEALADNGGQTPTRLPRRGSPVIDRSSTFALPTDQRGLPRPIDNPGIVNATGGDGADIGAVEVQAATYTVNTTADNGTGGCDATECTLREAVVAANATATNDTVEFSAAVFNVSRTITLNGTQLTIANNGTLVINGTGANLLTISGNNADRVLLVNQGANVQLNNLTIADGRSPTDGGGIYNDRGTVTLNNLVVRNNVAATSTEGGIANRGTLVLNNSTVSGNTAGAVGGGIGSFTNSTLTLNNSTVSGNTATDGGGIRVESGSIVTLNNSTVSGNTGSNSGGGFSIASSGSLLTLNSTTVSDNSSGSGGGLSVIASGAATLNNSIIANSAAGGECVRSSGTVNASYSIIEGGTGCVNGTNASNQTGDPNLGALANNGGTTQTHAPLAGSIAIDQGNSSLTQDQRGLLRPVDNAGIPNAGGGNGADIGAIEVPIATAASVSISGKVLTLDGSGLVNARVTLTDALGNTQTITTRKGGVFRFDDVEAGATYIIRVGSRRYTFQPQVISAMENLTGIDFIAQEPAGIF